MKRRLLRDRHGTALPELCIRIVETRRYRHGKNISGGQEKSCSRTTGTVGEDQSSQEIEGLNLTARMHLRRYARRTNAHIRKLANRKEAGEPWVAWHNFCQSEFRDPLHARYAGRFGNDDLDKAGFAGDVTTVADPHVSRRRLSRSSNAQQSWLTRAASFLGSISLLACSAMVRHSSEYGFMTGLFVHENTLLWRPEPSLSNNAHCTAYAFIGRNSEDQG
jgi:hypothetical protein